MFFDSCLKVPTHCLFFLQIACLCRPACSRYDCVLSASSSSWFPSKTSVNVNLTGAYPVEGSVFNYSRVCLPLGSWFISAAPNNEHTNKLAKWMPGRGLNSWDWNRCARLGWWAQGKIQVYCKTSNVTAGGTNDLESRCWGQPAIQWQTSLSLMSKNKVVSM